MDHINLTSTEPFIPAELPRPARLTSYREAISTVNYYVGRYADRINEIASSQGYESRQRLLFAIVRLIFFWKEKKLPVTELEDEVTGLLEWAEANNLSSPFCII